MAVALVLGIAIGIISRSSERIGAVNSLVAKVGLTLLLVNMGAKLASDSRIRADLARTGASAVVLAMSSIAGSVLFVRLLTYLRPVRYNKKAQRPQSAGVSDSVAERGEAL